MLGISQFMEKLASLPPTVVFDPVVYPSMVLALDVRSDIRSALLDRDGVGLAGSLGLGQTMFCMIIAPDGTDDEAEKLPGEDEEAPEQPEETGNQD